MKDAALPIDADDEARAWKAFSNSLIQTVLHNEMVKLIDVQRRKLESVGAAELEKAQDRVKQLREILGMLHRHDAVPTRYKNQDPSLTYG